MSSPAEEKPWIAWPAFARVEPSSILKALPSHAFVPVRARFKRGRVLWLNTELAREVGIGVPQGGLADASFRAQLLRAFSWQTFPGEAPADTETITLYADRYGGIGSIAGGSARAAFLPFGNFFLKGIGLTPLFRPGEMDMWHSTGRCPWVEGAFEAVFGELYQHLLTEGSARVLAILDQNEFVQYPDGSREPVGVVVRTGPQIRPAHLLARRNEPSALALRELPRLAPHVPGIVLRRERARRPYVDLTATFAKLVDQHARTAAEQLRFRLLHGALSPSNMQLSGAMLDTAHNTTLPRTGPARTHNFRDETFVFGREHESRAHSLTWLSQALRRSVPKRHWRRAGVAPIAIDEQLERAYQRHLALLWLEGVGLGRELSLELFRAAPELASDFGRVLTEMALLSNPSSAGELRLVHMSTIAKAGVLDVCALLAEAVALGGLDDGRRCERATELLAPIVTGNLAQRKHTERAVERLTTRFCALLPEVLARAASLAVPARHATRAELEEAMSSRAHFENQPLTALHRPIAHPAMFEVVREAVKARDGSPFARHIDALVGECPRRVSALLTQGSTVHLASGAVRTQEIERDGVRYAIELDARRRLTLCIELPREQLAPGPCGLGLRLEPQELAPALSLVEDGRFVQVRADIPDHVWAAHVELSFEAPDGERVSRRRYAFARPDAVQLERLSTR